MKQAAHILMALSALILASCEAPPSVQKVIDENKEAEAERLAPRMDNPVLGVAREEGKEIYNLYLIGRWAPAGACSSPDLLWKFTEDSFTPPEERPCNLALIEALQDGSYAIAGYCPRIETEDEPQLVRVNRVDQDNIIITGTKGGPLRRCE